MAADDLTRHLRDFARGSVEAWDRLLPHVYDQLRRIANRQLGKAACAATLEPTAIVHEAFVKLFDRDRLEIRDRQHFLALASKVMRDLLVDYARRREASKRAGGHERVTLRETLAGPASPDIDVLDLHEQLLALEELDARQARVVELRFFGGLEVQETADVLDVSLSTVERELRAARAWLGVRLGKCQP